MSGRMLVTLRAARAYSLVTPSSATLELRARRAYELARVRRALWGVGPLLLVLGLAAFFSSRVVTTCLVGAAGLAVGAFSLWRGEGLQRALVPGVIAGLVPLTFSLCATRYGHACFGGACMQVCLAAAALGGIGAGLIVSRWTRREGGSVVITAAALGLLTGSMGSSCVGLNGVLMLALGFSMTMAVASLARRFA